MKKIIILIPIYNDWESFIMISDKINDQMRSLGKPGQILVVNDNSSVKPPKFSNYSNIETIELINLNKNLGSQKAISIGLQYLRKRNEEMIITILDSDGEDDVSIYCAR